MSFVPIPINGQTWLICGGRDFSDKKVFDAMMSQLTLTKGMPSRIIHGAARGSDTLASEWAVTHAIEQKPFPALWHEHGKAAGPIRNQQMLDAKPDMVVAFPGGKGTADMVARARSVGISVAEIKASPVN